MLQNSYGVLCRCSHKIQFSEKFKFLSLYCFVLVIRLYAASVYNRTIVSNFYFYENFMILLYFKHKLMHADL